MGARINPVIATRLAAGVGLGLATGPASYAGNGDHNGDGVIDSADFAALPACMSGPDAVLSAGCGAFDFDRDLDVDVADLAGFQLVFGEAQQVVIETVAIGNPGNPGDPQLDGTFGGVAYVYNIGKYEITAGQYAAFLNAVAATDTYGLYNTNMWTHAEGCKIERSGAPGSYTYSVGPDWADRPVNFVSWGDAARLANWLHNGQPTGAQDSGTTEDGSYLLSGIGENADHLLEDVVREPDATWVIPSEDEWYKAAYHANDGATGNYFNYPTAHDFGVSNDLIDPDPGNNATFWRDGHTIGSPYFRTEAGAHENSASAYGAFDQGGNVMEWNESIPLFGGRGLRGGAYLWGSELLGAGSRPIEYHSSDQFSDIGFRLVELR